MELCKQEIELIIGSVERDSESFHRKHIDALRDAETPDQLVKTKKLAEAKEHKKIVEDLTLLKARLITRRREIEEEEEQGQE